MVLAIVPLLTHTTNMLTNKLLVLLIAFTGLMATVYTMARFYTPRVDWVTVSLPDPPRPLPDPALTFAALAPVSGLAAQLDSTAKEN